MLLHSVFLLFKNLTNVFRKYKSSFESSWINSSDAPELSSARIQLELEAFQLGSARLVGF